MTRAEAIEQDREKLAELGSKYGLLLRAPDGSDLYAQTGSMKLHRKILSPPKTVIPCSAVLEGFGPTDPCLVVPASLPLEVLPPHRSIAAGGQVMSVGRSVFALPNFLMDEAWRPRGGFWSGQPLPLLVAIRGDYRYLVRPKSCFFRHEGFRGSDLDHLSPLEPDTRDLKLNRFHWGNDLSEELTLIVAEY
jgi:hypothetical protein